MSSEASPSHAHRRANRHPRATLLRLLGPGVIAGAADDDPSGIATYSQAGAQFGVHQLWSVVLTHFRSWSRSNLSRHASGV
jgi:Mn2+/Fe2+ NRAMP family transporter